MAPTIGRVLELDLWAVVVWSGLCGQEASKAVQYNRQRVYNRVIETIHKLNSCHSRSLGFGSLLASLSQ